MYRRNRLAAGLAAITVAFALGACDDSSPSSPSSPSLASPEAEFQNESRQFGLVNVSTGNIDVLNNVNLAVAANVIATVCDVTIAVAVLAEQLALDGTETFCAGTAEEVTITQAQPGQNQPSGPGGGNQSQQAGLVNVSVGDVAILNDVNAAIAANVLVTVCDLTVAAAVLAVQGVGDAGETFCENTANPVTITQS